MSDTDATAAVRELRKPYAFVQGTRGNKLSFPTSIRTLDTHSKHTADALVNSGCEGSCIDDKYVKELGLNTTPLIRPIPVHNADGTLNAAGSIREIISLEVKIKDHVE